MNKFKIVLVEDHTLLSQAIAGIIDSFENFEVLYSCKNGLDLTEKIKVNQLPNLILMDVKMPIMNGIETTKWLKINFPDIPVLALTVEEDEKIILDMLCSGARGYLLKDVDKQTLEIAMKKIIETGFFHTSNVSAIITNSLSNKPETNLILKTTETEFLKLVCTELTYKEIANKMNLSPKTIDGYRDNLFVKINAKNRIGLVIYAIKNKIFIP